MQKNKYKYVSVAAMIAVMLLLGLYMWMTYRSAVSDISERAGNELTWGMFYESWQRAEIVSVGDTLSLPHLRGDLSLESSVEGMNDVLSRRYHSEVSLDTLALYVDSLLSVVSLDRNFTVMEVDADGRILSMEEKPANPKSHWCIPAFYYYTRQDARLIKKGIDSGCGVDAPGSFIAWLAGQTPVHAWEMPGRRYDIGNLASYEEVQHSYKGI